MLLRLFFTALSSVFLIFCSVSFSQAEKQFTLSERRWAERWINRDLAALMADGTIKKIEAGEAGFKVFVGESWHMLDFQKKTEHLQNISRARQIAGHSPFFNVFEIDTEEVVARVRSSGVEILIQGQGFVQFMPDFQDNSTKTIENIQ